MDQCVDIYQVHHHKSAAVNRRAVCVWCKVAIPAKQLVHKTSAGILCNNCFDWYKACKRELSKKI